MDWKDPEEKILIAGSGRCGTTFFVQLLTLLGLPTGIDFYKGVWRMLHFQNPTMDRLGMAINVDRRTPKGWSPQNGMAKDINAGLEYHVSRNDNRSTLSRLPKIIKNPRFAVMLERMLREDRIRVGHVFICVRNLGNSARSKADAGKKHPRERYYQKTVRELRRDCAAQLGELAATVITHDIPHTFLHFPRIVDDPKYAHSRVNRVLKDAPVNEQSFLEAHSALANPGLVHFR